MKLSRPLSALILVASVLLINGVRSGRADPSQIPNPQAPSPTKSPEANTKSNQAADAIRLRALAQAKDKTAELKKSSEEDESQREELGLNELLTAYTGQLATYTFLLVTVGLLQLFLVVFQVGLSTVQMRDLLRPKIGVRSVGLDYDLYDVGMDATQTSDLTPPKVWVTFINRGGFSGQILAGNFTVRIGNKQIPVWGLGEAA